MVCYPIGRKTIHFHPTVRDRHTEFLLVSWQMVHELLAQQWTTQAEKIAFERRIQEQEKDEKHEKHKMTRQMTLAEQMLQEQADNLQSRNSFAVQSYKFMFDF